MAGPPGHVEDQVEENDDLARGNDANSIVYEWEGLAKQATGDTTRNDSAS